MKKPFPFANFPLAVIILCAVSIIALQLTVNQLFARPPLESQFALQSLKPTIGGFFQNHKPSIADLQPVSFPFTFYIDAPQTVKTVFIDMAYICEPECIQVWLELAGNPPKKHLIDHPALRQLSWFFVSNGQQQFFQRAGLFPNPETFLLSQDTGRLASDKTYALDLVKFGRQPLLLEDTNSLPSDIEFVLTTYQFPKHQGNWHLARKLDITQAARNSQGYLSLTLTHHSPTGTPSATLYVSPPTAHFE